MSLHPAPRGAAAGDAPQVATIASLPQPLSEAPQPARSEQGVGTSRSSPLDSVQNCNSLAVQAADFNSLWLAQLCSDVKDSGHKHWPTQLTSSVLFAIHELSKMNLSIAAVRLVRLSLLKSTTDKDWTENPIMFYLWFTALQCSITQYASPGSAGLTKARYLIGVKMIRFQWKISMKKYFPSITYTTADGSAGKTSFARACRQTNLANLTFQRAVQIVLSGADTTRNLPPPTSASQPTLSSTTGRSVTSQNYQPLRLAASPATSDISRTSTRHAQWDQLPLGTDEDSRNCSINFFSFEDDPPAAYFSRSPRHIQPVQQLNLFLDEDSDDGILRLYHSLRNIDVFDNANTASYSSASTANAASTARAATNQGRPPTHSEDCTCLDCWSVPAQPPRPPRQRPSTHSQDCSCVDCSAVTTATQAEKPARRKTPAPRRVGAARRETPVDRTVEDDARPARAYQAARTVRTRSTVTVVTEELVGYGMCLQCGRETGWLIPAGADEVQCRRGHYRDESEGVQSSKRRRRT